MRFLIACLIFIALAHLVLATPASLAPLPADECPVINLRSLSHICMGDNVTFEANVTGISSEVELTYNWTVSTGTIKSGQGTDTITIDMTNASPDTISDGLKATVEVSGNIPGAPPYCSREAYYTERVLACGRAIKFDEFGDVRAENEKEHLDSLAMELENKEYMTALVFVYAGKRARFGEAEARLIRARNYLVNERHVPQDRIVTLDGGYREELTFEVWTLPPRTPPVKPSPTVDFANVEIIDGPVNSTYH
jgi:hypothetical protein